MDDVRFVDLLNDKNRFLALEGIDCTGKGSITRIIEQKGLGVPDVKVKRVDFPQYDLPSGAMIKAYLNGEYGNYSRLLSSVPGENAVEWHAIATGRAEHLVKEIRFVMWLYALNRIDYFKRNEIEPDTVYVFDRFSYSNIIHHLSSLYFFYEFGAGEQLLQMKWRAESLHKEISFKEFKEDRIYGMLSSLYSEIYSYESYYDIPEAYTFLLLLGYNDILHRLEKRSETKHEGEDILERRDAIYRAGMFLSNKMMPFHLSRGLVPIDINAYRSDNEAIADDIIDIYKTAVINNISPEDLDEIIEEDTEEETDE